MEDFSKRNKIKSDSIQRRGLTSSLGVNRLAHKTDLNVEAGVLSLELRRRKIIIKVLRRVQGTPIQVYLENIESKKRLQKGKRKV